MKNLRNEIMERFNLNEIQRIAAEKVGRNLIIDAPTASGKTEAILLSIEEGSSVTWMLPTITSCTFMYRRLCHDFNNLNVRVMTSVMTEERILDPKFTTVNIITCDPYMVEYIKGVVEKGEHNKTTDSILVLDEIDNYPPKVRSVLIEYLSNVELKQVILASATLDEELRHVGDFEIIKFSEISNKIRYKSMVLRNKDDAVDIIAENFKKKKIGVICNSINEMESVMYRVTNLLHLHEGDLSVIFHHSKMSNDEKFENERRLFEGEYDLLISNDLVSMSVDVSLDLLIMNWSDKLNINIQRMGRLNRRNKKVSFHNLYILKDGYYPPFINDSKAESLFRECGFQYGIPKLITNDLIKQWSDQVELEHVHIEDIKEEVKHCIENNEEILLRDVPYTLRYEEVKVLQKRKKGKKIEAEKKTVTVDMKVQNLPYDYYYPCSEEDGERDLLYMPWMADIDHPTHDAGRCWRITNLDSEGIRTIIPYDGPSYKWYKDIEDEEDDDSHDEENIDKFTAEKACDILETLLRECNNTSKAENWLYVNNRGNADIERVEKVFYNNYPDLDFYDFEDNLKWCLKIHDIELDELRRGSHAFVNYSNYLELGYQWLALPHDIKSHFIISGTETRFKELMEKYVEGSSLFVDESIMPKPEEVRHDIDIVFLYSYRNDENCLLKQEVFRNISKEWSDLYRYDIEDKSIIDRIPIAYFTKWGDYVLIDPNDIRDYIRLLEKDAKKSFTDMNFPLPPVDTLYTKVDTGKYLDDADYTVFVHDIFSYTGSKDSSSLDSRKQLDDERLYFLLDRISHFHKYFSDDKECKWRLDNCIRDYGRSSYKDANMSRIFSHALAPVNICLDTLRKEVFLRVLVVSDDLVDIKVDINKIPKKYHYLLSIEESDYGIWLGFHYDGIGMPLEYSRYTKFKDKTIDIEQGSPNEIPDFDPNEEDVIDIDGLPEYSFGKVNKILDTLIKRCEEVTKEKDWKLSFSCIERTRVIKSIFEEIYPDLSYEDFERILRYTNVKEFQNKAPFNMKNLCWDCGQTYLNDSWLLMPYNIKEYFIEHIEPDFIKEADKNPAVDEINFRKEMEILTRDDLSHKNEDRDYYGFIFKQYKKRYGDPNRDIPIAFVLDYSNEYRLIDPSIFR